MAVVVFNYDQWLTLYPQFTTTVTTEAQGQEYFYQAQMYCSNGTCAPIPYEPTFTPPRYDRAIILNLLTAHIAALFAGYVAGGQLVPPSALVGRISNASEGSVSVATDMGTQPMSAAWYNQTPFGAMAYTTMAPYRTARYQASPGRFFQPSWPIGAGYYGGYGQGYGSC